MTRIVKQRKCHRCVKKSFQLRAPNLKKYKDFLEIVFFCFDKKRKEILGIKFAADKVSPENFKKSCPFF